METTPDISFFFAVHDHLRADLDRHVTAVSSSVAADRGDRLPALDRWAKGFTHELEEHRYVEDAFFFPHLRQKVPRLPPCSIGSSRRSRSCGVTWNAGRESEAATALASFDGQLADDWYRTPMTAAGVMAAAIIGDRPFLQRHAGELAPLSNRFVCAGNGGIVLGPVAYALALAQNELGETDAARRHAEQALSMSVTMGAARWTPRIERLLSAI